MQRVDLLIGELARLQDTARHIEVRAKELKLGLPAYIATILHASLQEILEKEREKWTYTQR